MIQSYLKGIEQVQFFVLLPLSCASLIPTGLSLCPQVLTYNALLVKKANQQVGDSVATAQQVVAESLVNSFSKKHCVAEPLKGALGAEVIPRAHERIIPRQMSIDTAHFKPVVHADL